MTKYRVARYGSRWVIEPLDDNGAPEIAEDGVPHIMTCGANPAYAEVMERIRWLEQDDAEIDRRRLMAQIVEAGQRRRGEI